MGLKWLMREVKNGFNNVEGGLDRKFGEGHSVNIIVDNFRFLLVPPFRENDVIK